MSGSSEPSNSAARGSSGQVGDQDPCSKIVLRRTLEAPVAGVVELLEVGAVLSAALGLGPPEVVAILSAEGSVAGSVVPTARLLECLRQGVKFIVKVIAVDGGAITLEIRAAL